MAQAALLKEEVEASGSSVSLIPDKIDPVALYTDAGISGLIAKVKEVALSEVRDISTPSGRATIKSLAAKVARSKTLIDDAGEGLIEESRKKVTTVNALRKQWRDEMDALKTEVRAPLTEWEDTEKNRMAAHEAALVGIEQTGRNALDLWLSMEVPAMEASIHKIRGDNRDYQEFEARHQVVAQQAIANLEAGIAKKQNHDADAEELKRLKIAEEKRRQDEREARIAKEAADKARADAEAKAATDAKSAEDKAAADRKKAEEEQAASAERERKAIADKEAADKRASDAEARIEKERTDAANAERERAERVKRDEEAAAAKREADKKHHAKINNEAMDAIVGAILPVIAEHHSGNREEGEKIARAIVTAIAQGGVPNVKISY